MKNSIGMTVSSFASLLATACGTGDPGKTTSTIVADSAGIEIIQHAYEIYEKLPTWTVDTLPEVRVGSIEGDADYLFMRITAALRGGGGDFYVLELTRRSQAMNATSLAGSVTCPSS